MPPDPSPHPWGEPPWRIDVALPPAPLPEHVEIAVVGAGFTGLASALRCAERGATVHVFEAGAIGAGASGRSGGIVLEGTAAGLLPDADSCLAALAELVAEHAIDCDLALGGCCTVRHVPGDPPPPPPAWPDEGGWLLLDRREPGGALDPGKLVAGLARAALRTGAVVHQHAPVTAIEPGPPARLRVGERSISAERVVLAVNAFLPRFLAGAGIRPALTLALATAPLAPDALAAIELGATPFYTADLPYLWGRATRDGRLVIGAGLAFDEADRVEDVAITRPDVRTALARVAARLRGLHPALAEVAIPHAWGGPIAFRAGGVPVLAETAPGVLATGACAGHGVALAAAIGMLAARWAREGGALPPWGRPA